MRHLFQFVKVVCFCLILALGVQAQRRGGGKSQGRDASPSRPEAPPSVEYLNSGSPAQLPFSEAVRVGHMLYLSGQLGVNASGALAEGGIAAETRQALENIRNILERHNSSMESVVKCTVMLADIKEFAAMNQVYRTFFTKNLPARSTFGTGGLVLGARVEIECWATVKNSPRNSVDKRAAGKYLPVHKYDPARNAEQDVADALAEARRTGKRVLLNVGGEWCIWCHIMDDYFAKDAGLLALREKSFIMVKINFSEENKNEQLLSRYPLIQGYPHIFVLGADGKLLHSQDTGMLEDGKGYNLEKFTAFLKEWSPPGPTRVAR